MAITMDVTYSYNYNYLSLTEWQRRAEFPNGHYQYFLKLNNRRRRQSDEDLYLAGYYKVAVASCVGPNAILDASRILVIYSLRAVREWCREQFGYYGFYVTRYYIWFAEEDHATACRLRWC